MISYNSKKDKYAFDKDKINFFINVGLIMTNKCNLNCTFCCDPPKLSENFSLEKEKLFIDKLAKSGIKKVCITGGEPLLNNDLLEVLKYLKQKEVCVTLYTNGLILDEEKIQSVKPYIDNIRFSILGGASTHDSLTQHTGSFEKVLSGIRLAKTFSIPVVATMPVLKKNISELIETVLLCESEGVEKFYIYSLMNRGRAKDLHGHQHISYNKINAELVLAKELLEKNLAKLEVGLVDWDVSGQCVLVYPTGDVLAVINGHNNEGTIKLGNLNEDSAKDLWEKYPFKEEYLAYYKKR